MAPGPQLALHVSQSRRCLRGCRPSITRTPSRVQPQGYPPLESRYDLTSCQCVCACVCAWACAEQYSRAVDRHILWERVFPSDYKCSREIEPDNWPVVRSDFPGYICSPMEKRVPTLLTEKCEIWGRGPFVCVCLKLDSPLPEDHRVNTLSTADSLRHHCKFGVRLRLDPRNQCLPEAEAG